jgi:hypothetical protein
MATRWRRIFLVALATLTLALAACDGDRDHVDSPFQGAGGEPPAGDAGSVSGTVLGASGAPVPFAGITAGDATGYADAEGRFFLAGVDPAAEIIRFAKDTRTTTNFRALRVVLGGEVHFPDVMLLPMTRGGLFYAGDGGEAVLGSLGTGALFTPASFITADSTIYQERVAVYMAVTVAGEPGFAAAFPGDFNGVRDDGAEVDFEAVGAVWTSIDSQAGRLDLAPGASVTYRLGVDDPDAPPAVDVWMLDLDSGRWRLIGAATLESGVYEAVAPTLAPVCWAVPAQDWCEVSGRVVDQDGLALANARVVLTGDGGGFRQATMTAADGSFRLPADRRETSTVRPYFGTLTSAPVSVDVNVACPFVITDPLAITLPDYAIDLSWGAGHGDLDASYLVAGEWRIDHVDRGSLEAAPYAWLEHEAREGGGDPERIVGRRWYDGVTEYWVHDYTNGDSALLRGSGAVVDLDINGDLWAFPVADVVIDAGSDSTGWWHVFDIRVDGIDVTVEPVQAFAPAPSWR